MEAIQYGTPRYERRKLAGMEHRLEILNLEDSSDFFPFSMIVRKTNHAR